MTCSTAIALSKLSKRQQRQLSRVLQRDDWRAEERRRYGSFGAASPCRQIDPRTGEVVGIVRRRPDAENSAPDPTPLDACSS